MFSKTNISYPLMHQGVRNVGFRKHLLTYYMDIIILYIYYLQVDILYSHKMTIKEKIKNNIVSIRKNNEQNKLKQSVSSKRNSNNKKKQQKNP